MTVVKRDMAQGLCSYMSTSLKIWGDIGCGELILHEGNGWSTAVLLVRHDMHAHFIQAKPQDLNKA